MKKILLISMPYGALERQALGLSLLKARLNQDRIRCDIRYLTFTFADLIGVEDYVWVTHDLPHTAFAGELTFRSALYGEDPSGDSRYVREVLQDTWRLDDEAIGRIFNIRTFVPHFLDYCMATIPWQEYTLVGFTSTFEQNISSLALAKRIKETYQRVVTVFGGGNWEDDMGRELHRRFPFVDYVCTGEADESFPLLVKLLLGLQSVVKAPARIKGLVYRKGRKSFYTGQAGLITQLDTLPVPDYGDYFRDFTDSSAGSAVVPTLLFEGSRGCWWGAKSHCTFCGLNGCTLHFRSKRDERILEEVSYLVEKWGIDTIQVVDNVIDMKYFQTTLPAMALMKRRIEFFWEVRANLTREQVRLLAKAGICTVQAGIESLNDHVLKLMRKGTTALQNIQFLKWCKEYGVSTSWNVLYGFPCEMRQDYVDTMRLLPSIRFLDPPTACGPIRLDRFSPYFTESAAFGLTNVRPMPVYKYLYPFDEESVGKIAYYFDYDYESDKNPSGYAEDVIRYAADWSEHPEAGTLRSIERSDGTLALVDTRKCAVRRHAVLGGIDREVYDYCDRVRSSAAVTQRLARVFPHARLTRLRIKTFLKTLVAHRLMVSTGDRYLSLAIRSSPAKMSSAEPCPSKKHATSKLVKPEKSLMAQRIPRGVNSEYDSEVK